VPRLTTSPLFPLQLLALEQPCRTGGRRAAELLLAAASGRLSWEQVLIGAVCSAQLDPQPTLQQQQQQPQQPAPCSVVPCNSCHARRDAACGQPTTAASIPSPPGCWRCAAPGTARRDWLTHGEVQALYQTQLGPVQTLRYIDAHREEVNQGVDLQRSAITVFLSTATPSVSQQWSLAGDLLHWMCGPCSSMCTSMPRYTMPRCAAVVRRALLGMGPAQDADLGAAQAALRDAADPLSRLCYPGPDGEL
jgi:hypothetical protein